MEEGSKEKLQINRRDFLRGASAAVGLGLGYLILDKRLPQIINKLEDLVSGPQINLIFFHEYHEDYPEELDRFRDMFQWCDVVVEEAGPWNDRLLSWYRGLNNNEGEDKTTLDVIRGSGKPIYFLDPKEDNPIWDRWDVVESNMSPDYSLSYADAADKLKVYLIEEVRIHEERERLWEVQLEDILEQLKRSNWLVGKTEINILILTGAYHTHIYHRLVESNESRVNLRRILGESPLIFSCRNEIMRRFLFKGEEPTDIDVSRVMMEGMILETFAEDLGIDKFEKSPSHKHKFIRSIVDKFNPEEVKVIFDRLKDTRAQNHDQDEIHKSSREILEGYFREKNIESWWANR